MNQILITGEEKVKIKKEKKKVSTNTIVSIFSIFIIILGIGIISGSVYAKNGVNEVVIANAKPQVEINRDDDNNTVEIHITHVRGITNISYKWNDDEETVIDGKSRKEISESIDLLGGKNTLTVSITEENGQTVTYEKEYTVGNIPEIKLEAVSNGVKVIAASESKINNIVYSWDDGEEQKIDAGGTETTYEETIDAPKGQHTLKIEVTDNNNMTARKTQVVVGDTEPTIKIKPQYVDGKVAFVIDAEDDENIKKIEMIHNGGTKEVVEVNEKTYHKDIIMTTGETNTLIVVVTNQNNLTKTLRVKFDNK